MNSLIISAIFLILFTAIVRKVVRSWLHPSALLLLMWSGIFLSTGCFAPEYSYSVEGGVALIALLAAFGVGGATGSSIYHTNSRVNNNVSSDVTVRVKNLESYLAIGTILGFIATVVVLSSRGFSAETLSDVDTLMEASHDFSVARYEDNYQMPGIARLLLTVNYVSVALSGICTGFGSTLRWNLKSYYKKLLLILPLMPQVALAIIMTTRAQVLYELIVWFSFYISGAVFSKRSEVHIIFTIKRIFQFAFFIFFLVFMFVALQFLRAGITDFDRVWDVLEHLKKWPFGSIGGFSIWWDKGSEAELAMGYYSFTGLFEWLGIRSRENGLYVDYVNLGGGAYGNIYTAFRGLIDDFGWILSAAFLFIAGVAAGYSYDQSKKSTNLNGIVILSLGYMGIIWSPIVSIYSYSSVIVSSVFMALLISRSFVVLNDLRK